MSTPTSFDEQYEQSKKSLLNAIQKGHSIILYGEGPTGKSHLIKEFAKELKDNGYSMGILPDWPKHEFHILDHKKGALVKWNYSDKIIAVVADFECFKHWNSSENHTGITIINMGRYTHPTYSRSRSGCKVDHPDEINYGDRHWTCK
jgi:GTPase SAR1 family protein